MTREDKIISEAKKYYKDDINCYNAFLHGVEFAEDNQWISVEDDLPCNHEELIHSNYTDRVLVLSRNGYSEVSFMCIIEGAWEWNTLITVLYWMPIPEPPK